MDLTGEYHEQKIAYARASLWAPFYAVGMAARVRGDVPVELVENALRKLRILYPTLASRVRVEADGSAWLVTQGVGEFQLEVRPYASDDAWAQIFLEQERLPFAFDSGPVGRFFLLRGERCSDLIAIVPHVVCDGYSMAHVMGDWVSLLNHPGREVAPPAPPAPVTWQTMPHFVGDNLLLRGLARVVNRAWPDGRPALRQERYENLHRSYWQRQQNEARIFTLSAAETASLAARCRQRGVSITGALVAAFLLAQADLRVSPTATPCEISVAVNIRDRMTPPPGLAVGVYASSIDVTLRPKPGASFWDTARQGHARIHRAIHDRPRILMPLVLEELSPLIVDELVEAVAYDRWSPEMDFLTRFVRVRGEAHRLDVSNIGRIQLPEVGTAYPLENLLPFPPLVPGCRLALNVLTIAGRMNLILKFRRDVLDGAAVASIQERALWYLNQ